MRGGALAPSNYRSGRSALKMFFMVLRGALSGDDIALWLSITGIYVVAQWGYQHGDA